MFSIPFLKSKEKKNRGKLDKVLIWMRRFLLFFLLSSLLAVWVFRFVPIRLTPLMLIRVCQQWSDGKSAKIQQKWVPIEKISAHMIHCVIASEDNKFLDHNGFDYEAIKKAKKQNKKGGKVYGASTISQQVAKNVFLWPRRSWIRKGLEAYFTVLIEIFWSKERIMEVYLNVVELGDGIYGVESASTFYYKHSSSKLNRYEAAMLATCLPSPLKYNPQKPTQKMLSKQLKIINLSKKVKQTSWGLHF